MQCTIHSIREIAKGTLEVYLLPNETYPPIQPGQCAQFTIPNPLYRDKKPSEALCNKRVFSFVHYPKNSEISFATRISDSAFKQSLLALQEGDSMEVGLPIGKFSLPKDTKDLVFLAGGIGVTPFVSMLEYLKETEDPRQVTMIFTNNNIETMGYKQYIEELMKVPNRSLHISIHKDEQWKGESRFISGPLIRELIPNYQEKAYMMVGPPPMIQVVQPILQEELLIPKEQIIIEGFSGY